MVPSLTLHDGVEVPQLGFGVFQVPPDDTQRVVEEALAAGYRHIDTAAAYRNEKGVGAAIAASGIPREEIFVTTKLWNEQQGHDSALVAFEKSLGRLGLDRVDLYLIMAGAAPGPLRRDLAGVRADPRRRQGADDRRLELPHRGPRAAGPRDRDRADREPGRAAPALPPDRAARLARRSTGSSPRPGARSAKGRCSASRPWSRSPKCAGAPPPRSILRWHLQLGNVVIPKSATPERIRENIDLFDFELSDEEMAAIGELDTGRRSGPDPATFVSP